MGLDSPVPAVETEQGQRCRGDAAMASTPGKGWRRCLGAPDQGWEMSKIEDKSLCSKSNCDRTVSPCPACPKTLRCLLKILIASHIGALGLTLAAYAFARRHAENARFTFGTGKVGYARGGKSRPTSRAGALWVSHPTEITSAPLAATAAT
nr:hypothetical protein [Rhabdochromatium marinum]